MSGNQIGLSRDRKNVADSTDVFQNTNPAFLQNAVLVQSQSYFAVEMASRESWLNLAIVKLEYPDRIITKKQLLNFGFKPKLVDLTAITGKIQYRKIGAIHDFVPSV